MRSLFKDGHRGFLYSNPVNLYNLRSLRKRGVRFSELEDFGCISPTGHESTLFDTLVLSIHTIQRNVMRISCCRSIDIRIAIIPSQNDLPKTFGS
jgi:hypothetical protein